jgi:AraC-like DNA-binding protein
MEKDSLSGLSVRQARFPAARVPVTFLVGSEGDSYAIVAVNKGAVAFAEYDAAQQVTPGNLCFIKGAAFARAVSDTAVRLFILQFSAAFAQGSLYTLHSGTLPSLFAGSFSQVRADRSTFKVIRKLFLLLYRHSQIRPSGNSAIICQLAFNLLLSCILDLTAVPVPRERVGAGHKVDQAVKFLRLVEEFVTTQHSVCFYAAKLHMTRGNLTRIIREVMGAAPKRIITDTLLRKAKMMLDSDRLSIGDIAEQLGFGSPSAFIHFFRSGTGVPPNAYRKRNTRGS